MSAVLSSVASAPGAAEQAFFESQKLPPQQRGMGFEALFYRQLQQVTARIHDTDNVAQIMLETSQDICRLLHAERLTLYATSADQTAIVSRVKTGLSGSQELSLPISPQSLAGYVAFSKKPLNLPDVYDDQALRRIHPELVFLKEVDARSGYRTRQMLVAPILDGDTLLGVLQVINNKSNQPFDALALDGVAELCKTLATALRQRNAKSADGRNQQTTKFDALVSEGLLTADELKQCVQATRLQDEPLETLLMRQFRIKPAQIGAALARFFGVPYAPFDAGRTRSEDLHGLLKRDFVVQQGWLPLEETPLGLLILCRDPEAVRSARMVPQVFPRSSKLAYRVSTLLEFEQTLVQLYGAEGESSSSSIGQLLAEMDGAAVDDAAMDESASDDLLESAAADNELVKFVNKLIIDAYQQKASDIHIEPMPGKSKTGIRFRIDGSLVPYIEVPAHYRQALITRLKIMCDLDISERRKPQDGKISFKKYGPLDMELRLATIPSAGGVEDVVMRILATGEPLPLQQLGLSGHNRMRLESTVSQPHGLFYVCGPTGSGKTTTLHSILNFLNTADTKIWTAEDPVEITQKGLRQVQINKKAGIDFALVMRAFLRADPDIIMVGESRDRETVSMGVEASLTGHLVFSTLHTNSAPESIVRLMDMGMDPFNFADALLGILAQRLVKRLCSCKQPYVPDEQELQGIATEYAEELRHSPAWVADFAAATQALLQSWRAAYGQQGQGAQQGQLRLYRAVGCERCNQTGYKGRLGLHELLVVDDALKQLIQQRAPVDKLFAAAVAGGMRTLKMDGMEKVLMGLTDLKMVRQVCIK